ncbi:MAG: N-acetylmuramoyl-L-alanine amidase, partial [Clostridia bacterium]|nr:N-acetylmuramoyl-L-alanine amidase [Clostridia bacterium]
QEMGFDTAMTRKTEEGLYDTTSKGFKRRDMEKRREIIQAQSPDLLLYIHQNYYPSATQRGAQVFYWKGDIEAEKLSLHLQDGLNALYAEEGVKGRKHTPAEYFILHCAPCPSALIECGFLSSPKDEKLLTDEEFLSRLVEGICQGVTEYFFSKA